MKENYHFKRSLWWFAPLILTQTLFVISQLWILRDCETLPEEAGGECATAWINLAILPAEIVALAISVPLAIVGILVLAYKYYKKRKYGATNRR